VKATGRHTSIPSSATYGTSTVTSAHTTWPPARRQRAMGPLCRSASLNLVPMCTNRMVPPALLTASITFSRPTGLGKVLQQHHEEQSECEADRQLGEGGSPEDALAAEPTSA
jgi:hypothetical protein